MRILLVQPPTSSKMVGFTSMVRTEPLALEIIAASVPEHEVKILDLRLDPSLDATLSSFKPELLGVTGYTPDVPTMLEICREVKSHQPEVITVVGGYHATLRPKDFDHDSIDVIVVGEGEITFRELISALEGKRDLDKVAGIIYRVDGHQVATKPRGLVEDLDKLPLPCRNLVDQYRKEYHFLFWDNPYTVETSRGCPYRCHFCAVWKFHQGKCRFRTPEMVSQELEGIESQVVCFVDDNFFMDLRHAERLYELIKSSGAKRHYWIQARADSIVRRPDIVEKWAEIGLSSVLIGLEKIHDEELAPINKRSSVKINEEAMKILHQNGVDIWGAFIVDPQWTKSDFDDLIKYVCQWKITFPQYTVLTPIPGTAFFDEKLDELTTLNYELYDFLHAVLPTRLPLEEFYSNMAWLYASTTMGWKELRRRVRSGQVSRFALRRLRELLRDVTNYRAYFQGHMDSIRRIHWKTVSW